MVEVYGVAIVGIIIGLVEVLKKAGLPKRFLPLASLILGIITGVVYVNPEDIKAGIMIGTMLGLTSCGLYSGTKNTIERG